MDVITTHLDAEFDSFASMVAAKKLYPEARLVFPGSQEKALREYLRSSPRRFGVQRVKSVDLDQVNRLIVVDTRRKDRIGAFAGILERPGLKVHVYDHHPPSPLDIPGEVEMVEDVGANITLMIEILKGRKLALSPEDATLFAIGLYEDTGSLTFSSTTARDLKAGAYLLEQGANLNVVSDHLGCELTSDQVLILNDLIRNLKRYAVRDVEVAVTTAVTGHYVADLSVVTHRLKEMHSLNVLFVAVKMGDRIHLVARSRVGAVDAGEIAYRFGGGGHPTAASATIKGKRLSEVTAQLRKFLGDSIAPPQRARDMMTSPVRHLDAGTTLAEARKSQLRTGLHILPVVRGQSFQGLITRPVTEKAIRHGFGGTPVSDYMSTEVETVTPATPFSKVEEIMVDRGQRFLPVVERKKLIGAITRTDYLRALRREASKRPPFGYERRLPKRRPRRRDMSSLLRDRLSPSVRELLEAVGSEGDRLAVPVYLVGGVVRDLLLNVENFDFDIMVEGKGIDFARRLGKTLGGRVNSYKRFETAVVILPDGRKIDVATARAEYYESPGAFPKVEHGTVKMDLFRRDFTINALALQLNGPRFGTLHDFFGGEKDIEDGMIRVLHNLSFVEDPTRVFRAIRFEQRLHFRLGEVTHRLIKDAVDKDLLEHIVGPRLFSELLQIMSEKNPLPALSRMDELGVLRYIHPKIKVSRTVLRLFRTLTKRLGEPGGEGGARSLSFIAALSEGLGPRQREDLMDRLALSHRLRERLVSIVDGGKEIQRAVEKARGSSPGEIFRLLEPWHREVVVYAWSRATRRDAVAAIGRYLRESVHVTTRLKGRDLKKLGYPPGPVYREMLSALLGQRIDGGLPTRDDERQWILETFPLNQG